MTDSLQIIMRDKLTRKGAGDATRPTSQPTQLPPIANQARRPRATMSTPVPATSIGSSTIP